MFAQLLNLRSGPTAGQTASTRRFEDLVERLAPGSGSLQEGKGKGDAKGWKGGAPGWPAEAVTPGLKIATN